MEKDDLSDLERKFSFNENDVISVYGSRANVYKIIEPNKVAKIMKKRFSREPSTVHLKDDEKSLEKLSNDLYMGKEAKEAGLNIPELYGIFFVKEKNSGKEFPGLISEYLDGTTISKMTYSSKNKNIEDKWRREIKKTEENFMIGDPTDRDNAIYVPKRDKVYLIDFMDWKFKK